MSDDGRKNSSAEVSCIVWPGEKTMTNMVFNYRPGRMTPPSLPRRRAAPGTLVLPTQQATKACGHRRRASGHPLYEVGGVGGAVEFPVLHPGQHSHKGPRGTLLLLAQMIHPCYGKPKKHSSIRAMLTSILRTISQPIQNQYGVWPNPFLVLCGQEWCLQETN